jgi:hypothetical protein
MSGFFKLILQLIGAAVIIFIVTFALVCFDGMIDQGEKSDAALVIGRPGPMRKGGDPLLDNVAKRFNNGDFLVVIVNDSADGKNNERNSVTAAYLEKHGVDPTAIVQDHSGDNVGLAARQAAAIMKERQLKSVIIFSDYYRITRMKIAVYHEGISAIGKAHVGDFKKEDAVDVAKEVFSLYDYMMRVFVIPTAEKVKDQAQTEIDKAKVDASKTKDRAQHSLDGLAK